MEQPEMNTIIAECGENSKDVFGTKVITMEDLMHVLRKHCEEAFKDSVYVFDFGKYKNEPIEAILSTDKGKNYIKWIMKQDNISKRKDFVAAVEQLTGQKVENMDYVDPEEEEGEY